MKTLYIECSMGAAGDMLTGALLELTGNRAGFLEEMNRILPESVHVSAEDDEKCGVTGTHVCVTVNGEEEGCGTHSCGHHHEHHHGSNDHRNGHSGHEQAHRHSHEDHHHHSGLSEIYEMIDQMDLSETVRKNGKAVYRLIAEAESKVHGKTMDEIHFHEVGTMDAVADVIGVCLLMEKISPERIVVSPVHVGAGSVKCAHGILPIPAPATALILEGVPIYGGELQGELCTPTGAALLKYFADRFDSMPAMIVQKTGYGMGMKDFAERPNCVRVMLGDDGTESETGGDQVVQLCANIDDMTGEELGFAAELLLSAGALDVYFESIFMKKFRPAVKLSCICRISERETFAALILKHTSTIGVREQICRRYTLNRQTEKVDTPWGAVEVKVSSGYGVEKKKPEADALARIAEQEGLTLREIKEKVIL